MRDEPERFAAAEPCAATADVLPAEVASGPYRLQLTGCNRVRLLQGGDELFAAMIEAIDAARSQVWLATYIFDDDPAAQRVAGALVAAARRGVEVRIVVDGFGSKSTLVKLRAWFDVDGVSFAVFRPAERWWHLLQPGQLRRLHQKLCVVDGDAGFVGGINIIDDRHDQRHGWTETPRLDFAVALQGPVVATVAQTARAMFTRARLGAAWREEVLQLVRGAEPIARARGLLGRLRIVAPAPPLLPDGMLPPVRVAFVVRDNLRHRRAIEQAYVQAITESRRRVDLVCPYFYPGRVFRRALRRAAKRGVVVRLLLQGKVDYHFAALAARVLYQELLASGVRVFEYTPAFLHAKIALVDDDWATVGSSNIDPLSLLLNLEANVIVRDGDFNADLARRFEIALQTSREVVRPPAGSGWWAVVRRGFVAWAAYWFLRIAGISGRY
jgi:cardiolipin synthase